MKKNGITSPTDFAKSYQGNHEDSAPDRLADFLYQASKTLPHRFVDLRLCAKVAFNLPKAPTEESHYVQKVRIMRARVEKKLSDAYKKEIHSDKIEGYRATVDDSDILTTKHRSKRKRVKSAISSLNKTDDLIDPAKLGLTERSELTKSRRALGALTTAMSNLPQLPPAREK